MVNAVAAQIGATSSMATNRFPLFCREGSGQFVLYLTQCVFNKPARPPVSEPRVSLKRRQCVYGGMCFVLRPGALQCNIQHLHHGTTICTRVYETAVNVCYRQTLMWQWCGETHWRRETAPWAENQVSALHCELTLVRHHPVLLTHSDLWTPQCISGVR